jgi:hypothetical protein
VGVHICIHLCMSVCVGGWVGVCVHICIHLCMIVCVCVCACVCAHVRAWTRLYLDCSVYICPCTRNVYPWRMILCLPIRSSMRQRVYVSVIYGFTLRTMNRVLVVRTRSWVVFMHACVSVCFSIYDYAHQLCIDMHSSVWIPSCAVNLNMNFGQ